MTGDTYDLNTAKWAACISCQIGLPPAPGIEVDIHAGAFASTEDARAFAERAHVEVGDEGSIVLTSGKDVEAMTTFKARRLKSEVVTRLAGLLTPLDDRRFVVTGDDFEAIRLTPDELAVAIDRYGCDELAWGVAAADTALSPEASKRQEAEAAWIADVQHQAFIVIGAIGSLQRALAGELAGESMSRSAPGGDLRPPLRLLEWTGQALHNAGYLAESPSTRIDTVAEGARTLAGVARALDHPEIVEWMNDPSTKNRHVWIGDTAERLVQQVRSLQEKLDRLAFAPKDLNS